MKEYYVIFIINSILDALNCFWLHYDRLSLINLYTLFDIDAL